VNRPGALQHHQLRSDLLQRSSGWMTSNYYRADQMNCEKERERDYFMNWLTIGAAQCWGKKGEKKKKKKKKKKRT